MTDGHPKPPPSLFAQALFVALGGALGALSRSALSLLIKPAPFPLATFIANLSGALTLGLLTGALFSADRQPTWLKAGLLTGFLGSYTTTSAFASESTLLAIQEQNIRLATIYIISTLLGGLLLARFGLHLGERLSRKRARGVAQ